MSRRESTSLLTLRLLFVATMGAASVTLAWVGWAFLEQDAELSVQAAITHREAAADLVVSTIHNRLRSIEGELDRLLVPHGTPTFVPPGVLVAFRDVEVRTWPSGGLLYYPEHHAHPDSPQAVAIARLAVAHLSAGRRDEALRAYGDLSSLPGAYIVGVPAEVAGQLGALGVFERADDRVSIDRLASQLLRDTQDARWRLDGATYRYLTAELARLLGRPAGSEDSRAACSAAVEELWELWRAGDLAASGRSSRGAPAGSVLVMWRSSGTALAAFVTDRLFFDTTSPAPPGTELVLTNADGTSMLGPPSARAPRPAVRLPSDTGLPWTVQVTGHTEPVAQDALLFRRRYMAGGLAVLVAVIAAGGWFISQAMANQEAAARLQSEFVSAVSHEFRTPLTTLCQLSELLTRGRVARDADRQAYYRLIHAESDRLRRLVESLLAFGQLESGRTAFTFEALDLAAFVTDEVAAFTQSQPMGRHRIEVHTVDEPVAARIDRQGMRTVLRNLLDNAVKYSPDRDRVVVTVAVREQRIEMAVADEGIGIPDTEQGVIFDRFVRGVGARERNIRGTGVGLGLARHIVQAHGGDIAVRSRPGHGSTFVVTLPAHPASVETGLAS